MFVPCQVMSTIYVLEPGSRLEKEYERFLVTLHDEVILRVPASKVSRVVFVGRVGATTAALHALLAANIPLLLISRSGKLLGQLTPPVRGNLLLRQAQYRRDDDEAFCIRLARAIVTGKLHNQRTLTVRLARRRAELDPAVPALLGESLDKAKQSQTLEALRGVEGYGARVYFHLFRAAFTPEWNFKDRNRRPPRDPVNALLSLGYTLLTQNMMTALEVVGLDPYLGYYHSETYNRPSLALDLVEEFRTPVVDSLVLWLINRRILQGKEFMSDKTTGGIGLTDKGLRIFFEQFSRKLESELLVRELERRISYRKLFEVQARKLARVITGEVEEYRPFRGR